MRIVSLLPSATEILFAIGAGDDVVGVTFECDHPAEARSRCVVSTSAMRSGMTPAEIDAEVQARIAAGEDLYRLDEGALDELHPDLVVTQDLCAVCAVDVSNVEAAMAHLGCDGTVLTIDPNTLEEVLDSIVTIGATTGRRDAALAVVHELRARLQRVADCVAGHPRPRVAVLEWTDPLFSAGHWVPDMVRAAGAVEVLGRSGERSVRLDDEAVCRSRPDLVVVAPCGYHLGDAGRLASELLDRRVLPDGVPVWAVDADSAFVRPGPRLVDGVEALAALCHPGMPLDDRVAAYVGTASSPRHASAATKC